jgi:hypothetical protein
LGSIGIFVELSGGRKLIFRQLTPWTRVKGKKSLMLPLKCLGRAKEFLPYWEIFLPTGSSKAGPYV